MRLNKIIEMLKVCPRISDELPYELKSAIKYRECVFSVRVAGNRSKTHTHGRFKTVYYLIGDEEAAIRAFIQANSCAIAEINFSQNNILDSGMPKWQARAIRDVVIHESRNL